MAYVTYEMQRTNTATGELLGSILIKFPRVTQQFNIGATKKTFSDLQSFPEFPVDATVFTSTENGVALVRDFGFTDVIDLTRFYGETWTLNNGAKIIIRAYSETRPTLAETVVYKADGSFSYTSTTDTDYVTFFPCLVDLPPNTAGKMYGVYQIYRGLMSVGSGEVPDSISENYYSFFADATPFSPNDDPYNPGGESTHGGGGGKFDDPSTPTDIPPLPTVSASETGFITLYNPPLYDLKTLATYLWSGPFDDATFKKLFANPMDAILGLSILPVKPEVSAPQAIKFGNSETAIVTPVVTSQYVTVDCGSLFIDEYWGAYLDYSPYTKIDIYLPYIGIHPLSADDVMNKTIHVVYHVDVLSGACVAFIQCDDSVIYSFAGQCSAQIPINGDNWNNVYNGAISVATSIGTMIASGGMTAPMGVTQIASTAVNSSKPAVEKSGSVSGACGMLSIQTPYLIITRPRQAMPKAQNTYTGYPSFITEKLADLNGYTEIESIHIENVPATAQELSEIESLLKSGVIF